jgi:Na+/phosphate symporter
MSEKPFYENPFNAGSAKVAAVVVRLQTQRMRQIIQSPTFREGVAGMMTKLIEMNRLLSKSFLMEDPSCLSQCERLAKEVHQEEKPLTSYLLRRGVGGKMFEGVIRFPYRLERIGDMLETIMHCCRVKIYRAFPFSLKAKEEVGLLLLMLEEMLKILRDAFLSPDQDLLEEIIAHGKKLAQTFEDFKSAHWERVEKGTSAPETSSLFREILDSVKWTNDYLAEMWTSLLLLSEMNRDSAVLRMDEVHKIDISGDRSAGQVTS